MNSCVQVGLNTWAFLCMVIGFIAAALALILWKLSGWRKPTGVIRGEHIDRCQEAEDA